MRWKRWFLAVVAVASCAATSAAWSLWGYPEAPGQRDPLFVRSCRLEPAAGGSLALDAVFSPEPGQKLEDADDVTLTVGGVAVLDAGLRRRRATRSVFQRERWALLGRTRRSDVRAILDLERGRVTVRARGADLGPLAALGPGAVPVELTVGGAVRRASLTFAEGSRGWALKPPSAAAGESLPFRVLLAPGDWQAYGGMRPEARTEAEYRDLVAAGLNRPPGFAPVVDLRREMVVARRVGYDADPLWLSADVLDVTLTDARIRVRIHARVRPRPGPWVAQTGCYCADDFFVLAVPQSPLPVSFDVEEEVVED